MVLDEIQGEGKLPRKMCSSTSTKATGALNTVARQYHSF